jgi:hypothetical protein
MHPSDSKLIMHLLSGYEYHIKYNLCFQVLPPLLQIWEGSHSHLCSQALADLTSLADSAEEKRNKAVRRQKEFEERKIELRKEIEELQ